jgi:uncharacterized protein
MRFLKKILHFDEKCAHTRNFMIIFLFIVIGHVTGVLAGLLGVGGGIFLIPIFLGYHISLQNTVANSSASTLTTALVGTILYLFIGYRKQTLYQSQEITSYLSAVLAPKIA